MWWRCILGTVLVVGVAACGSTSTATKTVTRTVTTISPGGDISVVPFVQGLTEALAVKKLGVEGLAARVVRHEHAGVPSGVVYDQSPSAGSHRSLAR